LPGAAPHYENIPPTASIRECKRKVAQSSFVRPDGHHLRNWGALVQSTECAAPNLGAARGLIGQKREKVSGDSGFTPVQIARVPAPTSAAGFRLLALQGLPIILTGMFPGSPFWDWDYTSLKEKLGHFTMHVREGHYDDISRHRKNFQMNVSTFIGISSGEIPHESIPGLPLYLGNNKIGPEMIEALHYKYPPYFEHLIDPFIKPSLWVGPAGSATPLHKDGPDNFVFQISGVKRWTIFPPADLEVMDCLRCTLGQKNGLCWSSYNVVRQCDRIPAAAHPIIFDLHPGEVYYQPSGWLHTVQNVVDTIMLNQWFNYDVLPQVLSLR